MALNYHQNTIKNALAPESDPADTANVNAELRKSSLGSHAPALDRVTSLDVNDNRAALVI